MKKIIGLFIIKSCFVFTSYAVDSFSTAERQSISNDNIGYARQYLQDSLDWNEKLNSEQKNIIETVYKFLDKASSASSVEFIELINYIISEDFQEKIYDEDPSVIAKLIMELEGKYIKAINKKHSH